VAAVIAGWPRAGAHPWGLSVLSFGNSKYSGISSSGSNRCIHIRAIASNSRDFLRLPWLTGMVGLFVFEFIEGNTMPRSCASVGLLARRRMKAASRLN
jgi:hypothetical protein